MTPVCGSEGGPLRHNQRQVGGQAASATAEKVALLVWLRVQSFYRPQGTMIRTVVEREFAPSQCSANRC